MEIFSKLNKVLPHIIGGLFVGVILFATVLSVMRAVSVAKTPIVPATEDEGLSYVALGDSYTIGQGIAEKDSFPRQLVAALREENIRRLSLPIHHERGSLLGI